MLLHRKKSRYQGVSEVADAKCREKFAAMDSIDRCQLLSRLAFERLERKARDMRSIMVSAREDWYQTLFEALSRTVSDMSNRDCYQELARRVKIHNIMRERQSRLRIEALLFGTSGLLSTMEHSDIYINELRREFDYLRQKYCIEPMDPNLWKISNLRTANHPYLRFSEIASLLLKNDFTFEDVIDCTTAQQVEALFSIESTPYWSGLFDKAEQYEQPLKRLGCQKAHLIGINLVAVIQYLYGKMVGKSSIHNLSIELWERLPAERNRYTMEWDSKHKLIRSAMESQAIIQLSQKYCEAKRCEECPLAGYEPKSDMRK